MRTNTTNSIQGHRVSLLLRGAAIGSLCIIASLASGQAVNTASKTTDISVFGGYTNITPDYAHARDNGLTFGANATRYFHFPVKPGVEARYTFSNGPTVNENAILFGPRGQFELRRFHPYVDFLFGHGTIGYNFPNPSPATTGAFVTVPGAGVDIDIFRNFQAKADFQFEHWNFGGNYILTPAVFTFGVTYRIPFKPRRDHAIH
jgi:hypothetical protein